MFMPVAILFNGDRRTAKDNRLIILCRKHFVSGSNSR
jgi:hypothetical protein